MFKQKKRGGVRSKSRRLNKAENKSKFLQFSLLGNNTAGLKSKADSLNHLVKTLNYPSCITLQETKLNSKGSINL